MAGRGPTKAQLRRLLPNERQYQNAITEAAEHMGWAVCWHRAGQNRDGTWVTATTLKGWPDLTLIRPPRLIFAEIKGPTTPVKAEQLALLALLDRCEGAEAYLWRSGVNDLVTEIVPILRRTATLSHVATRKDSE